MSTEMARYIDQKLILGAFEGTADLAQGVEMVGSTQVFLRAYLTTSNNKMFV